jgi:hypothetical protein
VKLTMIIFAMAMVIFAMLAFTCKEAVATVPCHCSISWCAWDELTQTYRMNFLSCLAGEGPYVLWYKADSDPDFTLLALIQHNPCELGCYVYGQSFEWDCRVPIEFEVHLPGGSLYPYELDPCTEY